MGTATRNDRLPTVKQDGSQRRKVDREQKNEDDDVRARQSLEPDDPDRKMPDHVT